MRLTLLGTGDAIPTARRDSTHYVVADDDGATTILVDAAGSTYHHLRRIGLQPAELSAVILTHEHPDHVGGFGLFAHALHLIPAGVTLRVFGPHPAVEMARKLCEVLKIPTDGDRLTIHWNTIDLGAEPAEFTVNGAIRVRAIPAVHPVPSAALRFDEIAGGASLVSSSDSDYNPALTRLAAGCDLLLHDCRGEDAYAGAHASAADVARTANEAAVGTLMPVHLVEADLPQIMGILQRRVRCRLLEPRDCVPIRIHRHRAADYEPASSAKSWRGAPSGRSGER